MKLLYIAGAATLVAATATCDNPLYDSPCPDAVCVDGVCTDACANTCGSNTMCVAASSTCVADCAPPRSACCSASSSPNCDEDDGIASCVCAFDEFCCQSKWDDQCVSEAEDSCGLACTAEENYMISIVRDLESVAEEGGVTMVSPLFFQNINTILLSSGVEPVVLDDAASPLLNAPVPPTGQPAELLEVAHALRTAVVAQLSANSQQRRRRSEGSAPIVSCAGNFGSSVNDAVCCGQPGSVDQTKSICPKENPVCMNYQYNIQWGVCGPTSTKICTNLVGPSALSNGVPIDNIMWPATYSTAQECVEACEGVTGCNGLHYYLLGDSAGAGDCYLKQAVTTITYPTNDDRKRISSICTYPVDPVTPITPGGGVVVGSKLLAKLLGFAKTFEPILRDCLTEFPNWPYRLDVLIENRGLYFILEFAVERFAALVKWLRFAAAACAFNYAMETDNAARNVFFFDS